MEQCHPSFVCEQREGAGADAETGSMVLMFEPNCFHAAATEKVGGLRFLVVKLTLVVAFTCKLFS